MAVPIYSTNINATTLVGTTSRYTNSKVIYWSDNSIITFTIYKKSQYTISDSDKYVVIDPYYEYRPDLLSYDFYGLVDFWWLIMEFNNIKDIFDFTAGTTIILPPLS